MHHHEDEEGRVLAGTLSVQLDGRTFTVPAGSFFLVVGDNDTNEGSYGKRRTAGTLAPAGERCEGNARDWRRRADSNR